MRKFLVAFLTLAMLMMLAGCDSADYKKAVSLYESGEYMQAMELFEALGDYEDSPERVLDCNYQIAGELADAGKYQEAYAAFQALGDYKNALDMANACNYQIALDMADKGEYYEAMTIFLSLNDYKDSYQQSVNCVCQLAETAAENGGFTEAIGVLSEFYPNPKARETFFVLFANEVTDNYLVHFQEALDSWNEYILIWMKAVKAAGDKTPVGGTVDIPKVDQNAPQVIALQRSMEKANKSVEKLREAYSEEILQVCEEDMSNLINTFFTSAETINQQFKNLDSWAMTLLFYGIQDNNAAKANNQIMQALYNVQDMVEVLAGK